MDIRQTFGSPEELRKLLTQLKLMHVDVSFLIDREGLFRASGKITNIDEDDLKSEVSVWVDGVKSYLLSEIIAVNGIFRSDYSEC